VGLGYVTHPSSAVTTGRIQDEESLGVKAALLRRFQGFSLDGDFSTRGQGPGLFPDAPSALEMTSGAQDKTEESPGGAQDNSLGWSRLKEGVTPRKVGEKNARAPEGRRKERGGLKTQDSGLRMKRASEGRNSCLPAPLSGLVA